MIFLRRVSGGWAGWAIAHQDFGRIEGAARKRRRRASHYVLLAHPDLGSYLRPCFCTEFHETVFVKTRLKELKPNRFASSTDKL